MKTKQRNQRHIPKRTTVRVTLLALAFLAGSAHGEAPGTPAPEHYRIDVKGPLGAFTVDCADPCEVDETTPRPQPAPKVSVEHAEKPQGRRGRKSWTLKRDPALSYAEEGIVCIGSCASTPPSTRVMVGPLVSLEEGVSLRIRDGRARFVFHSIVERDGGPVPQSRVSEFRIDRPRIELELFGHRVTVDRLSDGLLEEGDRRPSGSG